MIRVYAIPADDTAPFLMFIAEFGEESAHHNVRITHKHYTQPIAAYEFRDSTGTRRFELEEVAR